MQISRESFLREWKGLLRKVIEAIEVTGLQIEEQEKLQMLYDIEAAIPCFGPLYEAQRSASSLRKKDVPLTLPKLAKGKNSHTNPHRPKETVLAIYTFILPAPSVYGGAG